MRRKDRRPEDIYVQLMPLVKIGIEVLRIIHVVQQDLKNIVRNHLLKVHAKREKPGRARKRVRKFVIALVVSDGTNRRRAAVHGDISLLMELSLRPCVRVTEIGHIVKILLVVGPTRGRAGILDKRQELN